ncbi:sigma-E factor negative regulatory protein [Paraferrimonas sedimenticola]|uniref:Anti-sigma-E factor RseA n=1 Tax=Paraferrimonas sedimenticola TaxID=375674 RepID=A0AA37VZH6_9GAMM|nr:RseA family anti-sigma factor [Paraferrimonas sedimenticola]GLP97194.1 anti-sigma-E factor RseA [Paraferrimonas sedimenticola]
MTIERNEWISAAVDDENSHQTLATLDSETTDAQKWQSYHLIGDAMRDELPQNLDFDISAKVAAALEDEPSIVAPKPAQAEPEQAPKKSGVVVPFLRQFGQYAIAASVAIVAVIGIQGQGQNGADELSPLPVLQTNPLIGSASPVSLQAPSMQERERANASLEEQRAEAQRQRLNAYLQDHMLQQRLNHAVMEPNAAKGPAEMQDNQR